eukprot:1392855-Prymnesium_polylepis.1
MRAHSSAAAGRCLVHVDNPVGARRVAIHRDASLLVGDVREQEDQQLEGLLVLGVHVLVHHHQALLLGADIEFQV